jgi:hypothetical protein
MRNLINKIVEQILIPIVKVRDNISKIKKSNEQSKQHNKSNKR